MTYNDITWRHFATAAHAGVLAGCGTRRGSAGSRRQGVWVQFDVQFEACTEPQRLRAVCFQAFGCPHVIAVADWVAEHAVGLSAARALPESVAALKVRFAVPTEKLGRLLVIEDAWMAALAP